VLNKGEELKKVTWKCESDKKGIYWNKCV